MSRRNTYFIPSSFTPTQRTTDWSTDSSISTPSILQALTAFENTLVSDSIDNKQLVVYPLCGGTSLSNSINYWDSSLYQLSYFGGLTHNSDGMIGNGTNAFANTGVTPASIWVGYPSGLHVYVKESINAAVIGSYTGGGNDSSFITEYLASIYFALNQTAFSPYGGALPAGLYSVVRNDNTTARLYINGVLALSDGLGTTGANAQQMYLLARNGNGTADSFSTNTLQFASITTYLDATQMLNYYNAILTLQNDLSR